MIVIIDYKLNNCQSIAKKINKLGFDCICSSDPQNIEMAKKLILPGVGHFSKAMESLKNLGLLDVIKKKVLEDKVPILGICLGMQLFARESEEGYTAGLNFIDAKIKKFFFSNDDYKVPHVGWNMIKILEEHPLLKGIETDKKFYFTHSYHYETNNENTIAKTTYGYEFPAIIKKDNIYGTQFHPEKSHIGGFKIVENFVNM